MKSAGKLAPKSIAIGLCFFTASYLGYVIIGKLIGDDSLALLFWPQVLLLAVSGYISGYLAKQHGWLNGIMVGIIAPVALAAGLFIAMNGVGFSIKILSIVGLFWLAQSVVCCGIGGVIWDIQARMQRKEA